MKGGRNVQIFKRANVPIWGMEGGDAVIGGAENEKTGTVFVIHSRNGAAWFTR